MADVAGPCGSSSGPVSAVALGASREGEPDGRATTARTKSTASRMRPRPTPSSGASWLFWARKVRRANDGSIALSRRAGCSVVLVGRRRGGRVLLDLLLELLDALVAGGLLRLLLVVLCSLSILRALPVARVFLTRSLPFAAVDRLRGRHDVDVWEDAAPAAARGAARSARRAPTRC